MSDTARQRARIERQEQLKRDWQLSREHGRVGYVGNQAPALEGTTFPVLPLVRKYQRSRRLQIGFHA